MRFEKIVNAAPNAYPIATVCFSVSACAFFACVVGLVVNHWLSGWMAVGGMAGIGLFYLALGLLSLGSRIPVYHAAGAAERDLPAEAESMQPARLEEDASGTYAIKHHNSTTVASKQALHASERIPQLMTKM